MEGERGNCELNGRGKAACCTSSAQFSGKGMEGERGNCELNGRGKAEGNSCWVSVFRKWEMRCQSYGG
jgi:hypothetical protein